MLIRFPPIKLETIKVTTKLSVYTFNVLHNNLDNDADSLKG